MTRIEVEPYGDQGGKMYYCVTAYSDNGEQEVLLVGTEGECADFARDYREKQEQAERARLERETLDFYQDLTTYGHADLATAIEIFLAVDLSGRELGEQVRQFSEDTSTALDSIDVCYVALDHVLQMARNKISEVLDFDIANDIEGGTEFYVYGNYMCSDIDHSQEAYDQLEAKLKEATSEQLGELKQDKYVMYFLDKIDLELPKPEELA